MMKSPFPNVLPLKPALAAAKRGGYALGAFAPRLTPMIAPVLRAAMQTHSPLIVQISQRELTRAGITPHAFADAFFVAMERERVTVPVVLHLDHTFEMALIENAIAVGFTSVMIDASEYPLDENIARTRGVVAYAHARGVSVEAELGKIGTTDFVETDRDEELYTDPAEAERFVRETGVDALAVSVGTAHGVYNVRQPRVDYARLQAIRARTPVHLVLHGGSGVPTHMIAQAMQLPGGGISKVNIATDLEVAMLDALHLPKRITDAECQALRALREYLTVLDEACYALKYRTSNLRLRENLLPWVEALDEWVWIGKRTVQVLETLDDPKQHEFDTWSLKRALGEIEQQSKHTGGNALLPLAQHVLALTEHHTPQRRDTHEQPQRLHALSEQQRATQTSV